MRKIPTRIEIFGQEITIVQVDDLLERERRHGDWRADVNIIRVQTPSKDHPKDVCFQTYFHEVVHAALDLLGYDELSEDEAFVERLGQAPYQADKTRYG